LQRIEADVSWRVFLLEAKKHLNLASLKELLKNLNRCTRREVLFDFSSKSRQQSSVAEHPRSEMLVGGAREGSSSWLKIPSLGLAGKGSWGTGGEGWAVLGQEGQRPLSGQVGACAGDFAPGRALPTKG